MQLDLVIKAEAIETAHQISQIRIIEQELQRLDALATAAQLQLVFAVHRFDADEALIRSETTTDAGELVTGIGHDRSHHRFEVVAGALEFGGTHQLKPPARKDADGVSLLSIRQIWIPLHHKASGCLFVAVNGFQHGCSGCWIQQERPKPVDATRPGH